MCLLSHYICIVERGSVCVHVCVYLPVPVVHGFSLSAGSAELSLPPRPGSWHISPLSLLPAGSRCPCSSAAEPPDSGSSGLCLQSGAAPAPGHSAAWERASTAGRSRWVLEQKCIYLMLGFVLCVRYIRPHQRCFFCLWTDKMLCEICNIIL